MVKHTIVVNGITRVVSAKNYIIACGPAYDPWRDAVVFTVTYHGRSQRGC